MAKRNTSRPVKRVKRSVERKERFLPLLMPVITNLLKDVAFKDAINRGLDAVKVFLDQFIVRQDKLEKRMAAMEHSLEIMVNARKKLGQWPADKEIKFQPKITDQCVDDECSACEQAHCHCAMCTGDGLD